jgi:fucose permease
MGIFNLRFYISFFSIQLKEIYNVADEDMGYYFCLFSISYLILALTYPRIFGKLSKKISFVACFLITSFSYALMGPSKLLGLP